MDIILASGSPRRIELMLKNGFEPKIIKPDVDEDLPASIAMEQAVMFLALKKALSVENKCDEGMIIAADTVVYKDKIIGKPVDFQDAFDTLRLLRGGSHFVATGVALVEAGTENRRVFCDVTEVFVKDYSDEDIRRYIETGEVWDKAGGYAIQGGFAGYIDHIVGDYDNVIGFPTSRVLQVLGKMGYTRE